MIIVISLILWTMWITFGRSIFDLLNIPKSKIAPAKVRVKEEIKPISIYAPFPCYVVIFEFDDGGAVNLRVSKHVYDSLRVGSNGTLAYFSKRFRKFNAAADSD